MNNYSCVRSWEKSFMLTYLHGKASGRLPVLISQAETLCGGSFGLSPEPALGQITHHSFILVVQLLGYDRSHGNHLLHFPLFCALLFIPPYVLTVSSSNILFLGLPLLLFSFILPSNTSFNMPSPLQYALSNSFSYTASSSLTCIPHLLF
jgi:hypothetical protein